jgi:hypothetical protein
MVVEVAMVVLEVVEVVLAIIILEIVISFWFKEAENQGRETSRMICMSPLLPLA